MERTRPYWKVIVSLAFSLLGTILILVIGAKALVFFMPFLIGWFISFVAQPLVKWLEKRLKIVRKLGSAIIIVLVLAIIIGGCYFAISKLAAEVSSLIRNFPEMYGELENGMGEIGSDLKGIFSMLPKGIQAAWNTMVMNLDKTMGDLITKISEPTVTAAGNFAMKIPSILIGVIVTFVSAYFFIADRDEVIRWAKKIAPEPLQRRMTMVIDNLKYAVGGYFKAQFKIMIVVAIILWVGLSALQVHYAILFAILIAFLDFLPFFGTGTALVPWAIYQFMMGDYKMVVGLVVLYAVTQLVRQLIQPKLVGDSMGLNPLLTLVLLYVGYKLGSLLGMIFAVPIGMIVINLYKAGAFDYILDDVKILAEGVMSLREGE